MPAQRLLDRLGGLRRRAGGAPVGDQFDAVGQPDAADVTDPAVGLGDLPDAGPQRLSSHLHPGQHPFVVQHVEHRLGGQHADLVAAEGGEERGVGGQRLRILAPGDHRADRLAVAHRLAEGDEVRLDPEPAERPERVAGAAVPTLHLVGDPQPTCGPGQPDQFLHVARLQVVDPVALQHTVQDRCCRGKTSGGQPVERGREPVRLGVQAAVAVRWRPALDVRRHSGRAEHLGRQIGHRGGDPVVGARGAERAGVAGVPGREPPGQVVGLGPGVDEEHRVQTGRTAGHQSLGELDGRGVQVPQIGHQQPGLPRDRLGHPRMGVPDARHVVVHVQESVAVGVGDPDAAGADRPHRLGVAERLRGRPEHPVAPPGQCTAVRGAFGRRRTGLADQPRGPLPSGGQDLVQQGERRLVVPLGELRVLQPGAGPPRGDGHGHGCPGRPQLTEQLQFQVLQRGDPLVPVEHQPGHPEQVARGPTCTERLEQRREVDQQRGVAHVAEVDDPGDRPVVVHQGVVHGQVTMHHLGAQRRPARRDHLVVPVQHPADHRPGRRLDLRQHRPTAGGVLHVPGHHPQRLRMAEPAQSATEPGGDLAPVPECPIVQQRSGEPAMTRQQVVHPDPVATPAVGRVGRVGQVGRPTDPPGGRAGRVGARYQPGPGHRQVRVDRRDLLDGERLHIQGGRILGGVRHLHHGQPGTVGGLEQEGLVAFAAEVGGGSRRHCEQVPADLYRLAGAEVRQAGLDHPVEGAHPGILPSRRRAVSRRTGPGSTARHRGPDRRTTARGCRRRAPVERRPGRRPRRSGTGTWPR